VKSTNGVLTDTGKELLSNPQVMTAYLGGQ